MSHLVVDVGTSGLRVAVVRPDATLAAEHHRRLLPSTPSPGAVEFDAAAMAAAALELAGRALAEAGPVASVGITNQRASTVVWDRRTGEPVGPGIGWQDLRTVGTCLVLASQGIRLAPNASATKAALLLDLFDAERARDLCFGTVDTWIAWTLSGGTLHVTDATNAAMTNLVLQEDDGLRWDESVLAALNIPQSMLPRIVDSSGMIGEAIRLPGAPLIAGMVGDQQASLLGQGCTRPGMAKATFGTGGMLDAFVGSERPEFASRGAAGCFPIIALQRAGRLSWGVEAVMLSAGTCVEWLRDDLGLIATAAESEAIAAACEDTGDVWFVPALLGLGTPLWDYGARATLVGMTRGTGRPEIVRAVLEGVADRGADLLEAAETDGALHVDALRVDGGMSANTVFVQALADAIQRPVEVSPVLEATALGAGFLAGLATGTWGSLDDIAATWSPRVVVGPRPERAGRRDRWLAARERSRRWIPELSALDF